MTAQQRQDAAKDVINADGTTTAGITVDDQSTFSDKMNDSNRFKVGRSINQGLNSLADKKSCQTGIALLDFCKTQEITFTRSRPYKKNDQAHVEEKNGSIVRRIIGYDRYEGMDAYNALSALYASLRLYVNFFQPSLKLISKKSESIIIIVIN